MYIEAFVLASLVSYLLTFPMISVAHKFGLLTDARKRAHPAHTHTGIVPRGGGLPIYLAILASSLIFIPANKIIIGVLVGSFLLVLVGLMDDRGDISPYGRFVANILISALVIGFGLGIPYVSNPLGGIVRLDTWQLDFDFFGPRNILVVADFLAIVWLSWTTNMVNWSKGVDGQLPGFVTITAVFLGLLAQRFTVHDINVQTVAVFSFAIAGAYLGFLPHNFYPQKIMPGYGGGALAGFLLGVLSILSFGKVGTAILIMSVPMTDAVYTIIRRFLRGKSIFKADWGHLHHRLIEIGWGKRRIAVFYWLIALILGISSLFLRGFEKLVAFMTVGAALLSFIVIIGRLKKNTR